MTLLLHVATGFGTTPDTGRRVITRYTPWNDHGSGVHNVFLEDHGHFNGHPFGGPAMPRHFRLSRVDPFNS